MGLLHRLYARAAPEVWETETRLLHVLRLKGQDAEALCRDYEGRAVAELEPSGKAAAEITRSWSWIKKQCK